MKRKKLLVQRTVQSLMKYGVFFIIILATVFACDNSNEEIPEAKEDTANFTAKVDGAIMGSVIAPNAEIIITALNSEETITGTTNELGEFFINGFPEGTYTVEISTAENENVQTFKDVEVRIGEVTELGTVTLAQQ